MRQYKTDVEDVIAMRNERAPRKWSIALCHDGKLLPEFMPYDHDTLKDARFYVRSIKLSNYPTLRFANGLKLVGVQL